MEKGALVWLFFKFFYFIKVTIFMLKRQFLEAIFLSHLKKQLPPKIMGKGGLNPYMTMKIP
jgi:hypothetical protein